MPDEEKNLSWLFSFGFWNLMTSGEAIFYQLGLWSCLPSRTYITFHTAERITLFLSPQGFGPEAKTRGGTLGVPGCIHTRTKDKEYLLKK